MKRKIPAPARRLPVDFGDEPLCSVPVLSVRSSPALRDESALVLKFTPAGQVSPQDEAKADQREQLRFNSSLVTRHSSLRKRAFTLVEILVVLVLLSLIVFALMAVFNGTQRAFRASLTQTDILEGGRAVMNLIANDLETAAPSNFSTNNWFSNSNMPVNLFISDYQFQQPYPPTPLYQSLIGSPSSALRTNNLENIYILSKGNIGGTPSWIGTGYSVAQTLPDGTLYPLYRFYMTTNISSGPAGVSQMFNAFVSFQYGNTNSSWSHLMDGVIGLTARVYDTNGVMMTNGYPDPQNSRVRFVYFTQGTNGLTDSVFFSNALPASVQIEMATLEDRTLEHAEGLSGVNQSNYLASAAGHVHLFRQRVWIRNLDRTAYQ